MRQKLERAALVIGVGLFALWILAKAVGWLGIGGAPTSGPYPLAAAKPASQKSGLSDLLAERGIKLTGFTAADGRARVTMTWVSINASHGAQVLSDLQEKQKIHTYQADGAKFLEPVHDDSGARYAGHFVVTF